MATVVLNRVAQILAQINANATQTEAIFARIGQLSDKLHLAQLTRDKDMLRQVVREAREYDATLRRLIQTQREMTKTPVIAGGAPLATAPAAGKSLPIFAATTQETQSRLAENTRAQQQFAQAMNLSGRASRDAQKFLAEYGFTMKDLDSIMVDPISKIQQFTFKAIDPQTQAVSRATFAVDRYGNVLGSTSTKFRGFADMISRNVVKVLEWAIAVGLVYGAFSQLANSIDTLKEIDEVMSDLALTTREGGDALNRYFEAALVLSRETGISMRDTLSIYDDAVRATSAITNETQRFAAAGQLMHGSLILSRLAGMDVTEAMDSLLGAMKQVGPATEGLVSQSDRVASTFQQTEHILDIWVFTSREARISVEDLAETFAITGAAASSAGLDIEELTALTAVLAEVTTKSATEIGNSVRRMLTTMQSETSVKALENAGIAIEDLQGNLRDWDEIIGELASRRRAGAITDEAFRQITYALGGGARGAADIAAIVDSWDQVLARTERLRDQSNVAGSAQKALEAKSLTLTNAINELNASFVNLVHTLGGDGGLMDMAILILEAFAGIINTLEGFVDLLGPATMRIAAFGAALAVLSKYGPALKNTLQIPQAQAAFQQAMGAGGAGVYAAGGFVPGRQQPGRFQQATQAIGQMAPAIAYAAGAAALSEGTTAEKLGRAGAIMAGATISTLLGGGPAVGAVIGDVAGSTIISTMQAAKLARLPVGGLSEDELRTAYENAYKGLETTLRGTVRKHFVDPVQIQKDMDQLISIYRESGEEAAREYAKGMARGALLFDPTTGAFGVDVIMQQIEQVVQKEQELKERGMPTEEQLKGVQLLATERDKNLNRIIGEIEQEGIINQMIRERQDLLVQLAEGEITKKQFKDVADAVDTVTQAGVVARETFEGFTSIPIEEFFSHWIKMAPEAREEIMSIVTRINQLEDAIAETSDQAKRSVLAKELKAAEEQAKVFWGLPTPIEQKAEDPFKFLGFTDFSELSEQEFNQVLEMAREFQQQYLQELGIPEEIYQESLDAWVAYNAESFKEVEDIHQTFVQMAKKAFDEAAKNQNRFNLQRLRDMDPSKIPELEQRTRFWEQFLGRIPGYESDKEAFNLVIGEEDVFHRMITTQEALRFAIQDLTEVEKKQLEGMWNIPEGATVMVPLQSLYYAPKGGTPGAPTLPPGGAVEEPATAGPEIDFGRPADKMDMAGDKMLEAALMLQQRPAGAPTEEAEQMMWKRAIETMPVGGFGPISDQQMANAIEPILKGVEEPKAPVVNVEVPTVQADISVSTTLNVDGNKVASAMNRWQAQKFRAVTRGRGHAGGGIIS